ncbi:protein of unknown function [Chryseobacterium sp. JV274]|nr:protein of unknown function [Chryseobacterium sp. JV274]
MTVLIFIQILLQRTLLCLINHCLIPSPKQVLINGDGDENLTHEVLLKNRIVRIP